MKNTNGLNKCPIGPSLPHLVLFLFTGPTEKSSGSQSVIRGPLGSSRFFYNNLKLFASSILILS